MRRTCPQGLQSKRNCTIILVSPLDGTVRITRTIELQYISGQLAAQNSKGGTRRSECDFMRVLGYSYQITGTENADRLMYKLKENQDFDIPAINVLDILIIGLGYLMQNWKCLWISFQTSAYSSLQASG